MIKQNTPVSILLISLREAFIDLIPFWVLTAISTLVLFVLGRYFPEYKQSQIGSSVENMNILLNSLYPLLTTIALSLVLSKNNDLPRIATTNLAIIIFILSQGISIADSKATANANFSMISIPVFTIYSTLLIRKFFLRADKSISMISHYLNDSLRFIPIYIIIILLGVFIFKNLNIFELFGLSNLISSQTTFIQLLFGTIIIHLFWFIGIHGSIAHQAAFSAEYYKESLFNNVVTSDFFNIFTVFGGSGATLALVIAILLVKKNKEAKKVAKIAIPFAIFNINEVIIYGLPIAFNRFYFLPFVFVPVLNLLISYFAFDLGFITVSEPAGVENAWIIPIFINGYIFFGIKGVILQAFLLAMSVYIYMFFVKKAEYMYSQDNYYNDLQNKFNLVNDAKVNLEFNYASLMEYRLKSTYNIKKALSDINLLFLHYQPKIDAKTGEIVGYEALLREKRDGLIMTPSILKLDEPIVKQSIDTLVANKLSTDLLDLSRQSYSNDKEFSFNLFPVTVQSSDYMDKVISMLSHYNVEVEIIEESFAGKSKQVNKTVTRLKKIGISTSVDDFGSGFSNISLLTKIDVSTIKIDRTLLLGRDEKSINLYINICQLCKNLGFKIVAEGVETKEQEKQVIEAGVDYLQGWLYSKAISLEEVKEQIKTNYSYKLSYKAKDKKD